MSSRRPTVSPKLVAHLREVFPLRNPAPGADIVTIHRVAGQQDVVEMLARWAEEANEVTERFLQGNEADTEDE